MLLGMPHPYTYVKRWRSPSQLTLLRDESILENNYRETLEKV